IEQELDPDRGRDRPADAADERRRGRRSRPTTERVQEVRSVDEEALDPDERVARRAAHPAIVAQANAWPDVAAGGRSTWWARLQFRDAPVRRPRRCRLPRRRARAGGGGRPRRPG